MSELTSLDNPPTDVKNGESKPECSTEPGRWDYFTFSFGTPENIFAA